MSKNLDFNIIKQLGTFGLSDKESAVYIELLQGGEMSAVLLSKTLEMHRQFVYNALAALKDRGLVLQIGEKRAKWRAQSPRKFLSLAEEQQLRATKVSAELLALMQQKAGQEFEVSEGNVAFRSRSVDMVRQAPFGSTILMISGQWDKYFKQMGEVAHMEWERVRLAKEIRFRIVGPRSFRSAMSKEADGRALTEYRIFPGLEENLVNTVIFDDHVDFEIYGEPHLLMSIKNPEVAESQKKFFEALWNKSEEL